MIIHDVVQNTPEWRMLRAGIPTASAMNRIITPKGNASSQAEKYKFRLLAERIIGQPLEDKTFSWSVKRGSVLEKKALEYYRFETDYDTQEVGFVTDDLMRYGASPDQFIGESGCLEIKCPEIDAHLMYLMNEGSAYEDYKIQAQAQLWICERLWTDFLSYHPDLPWSLVRINRDDRFIGLLSKAVHQFCDELELLAIQAKERGWFRRDSIREPQESEQDRLVRAMKESLIELNG